VCVKQWRSPRETIIKLSSSSSSSSSTVEFFPDYVFLYVIENHQMLVDLRLRPVRIKFILKLVSLLDEARRRRVSLLSRSLLRKKQQSYRSKDHRSQAIGHQSSSIKDSIVDYIRMLKTTAVGAKARCQLPSISRRPAPVITNPVPLDGSCLPLAESCVMHTAATL
jgi:hypothetical protein